MGRGLVRLRSALRALAARQSRRIVGSWHTEERRAWRDGGEDQTNHGRAATALRHHRSSCHASREDGTCCS